MSDFYKYFKENMGALGLTAPDSLFGTAQLAVGSAMTLVGLVEKFGKKVTPREHRRRVGADLGRRHFDC